MSRVESRVSRVKCRGSRVKSRGSRVKSRGSRVKSRGSQEKVEGRILKVEIRILIIFLGFVMCRIKICKAKFANLKCINETKIIILTRVTDPAKFNSSLLFFIILIYYDTFRQKILR